MQNFQRLVEAHSGDLSRGDHALITAILADPASVAFMSAESLGTEAGVHAATVVRLAKKLGFDGYPAMREAIQDSVKQAFIPADRMVRSLGESPDGSVLATVVGEEVRRLQQLPAFVSDNDLEEAAARLAAARRVVIHAHGHSSALGDLLVRRLRRSGLVVEQPGPSGRDIAESLVSLRAEDAVLGFALRSVPKALGPLLEHAGEVGATSIVIADTTGPTLRPRPDVLLAAPRGEQDRFLTLAIPMAICDALVLTLARTDGGRSLAALEYLGDLLEKFDT